MAHTLADLPNLLLTKAAGRGEDECWPWPGAKNDSGYGQIRIDGKLRYVHILSHEVFVGPTPDGLQIDHRCHDPYTCIGGKKCPHRPCFNFRHLKAVTSQENNRRSVNRVRMRCPQGHPYDDENTGWFNGHRYCRKCHSARNVARVKAERTARGPIPPKTSCRNGHPFDEENTYISPSTGRRQCRACKRDYMRRVNGYQGPPAACPRGHAYDGENTYIVPATGYRQCRTCNRERERISRSTRKGVA